MTSKEAFALLRQTVTESDAFLGEREIQEAIDVAEQAANDERADAFAEGRYATIEKVIA